MKAYFAKSIFFSILFLTACFYAYADVRIYGAVHDSLGNNIPGAEVYFIASDGDTTKTECDSTGYYSITLETVVDDVESENQTEFTLSQNYPNPFNPSTTIEFEINKSSDVKLEIFNVTGQRIRTLVDGCENSGFHSVSWDGLDDSGKSVSAGIYIYRLKTGAIFETKKMMLLDGGSNTKSVISRSSSPKISKTADIKYEIRVTKDGFHVYYEQNFIITDVMADLKKDFVLVQADFFPLAVGYRWEYREYTPQKKSDIGGNYFVSIVDTTIINDKKYFLMVQNWNTNIPDSIYVRKEGYKVFWNVNGKDYQVCDFMLKSGSSWEFPTGLGDSMLNIERLDYAKINPQFSNPDRFLKYIAPGDNNYWYELYRSKLGSSIIKYYNEDEKRWMILLLDSIFYPGGGHILNYDGPSLERILNELFGNNN